MLKYIEETKRYFDRSDFNDLVQETYKVYFDIVDSEGDSDSGHYFFRAQKIPLGEYDTKELENFIEGKSYCCITSILFNDLCNDGLIEEGNYQMREF